jgi:hypothetical protein
MLKITENLTEAYTLNTTVEDSKGSHRLPVSNLWTTAEIDARKAEIRAGAEVGATITFKVKTYQL